MRLLGVLLLAACTGVPSAPPVIDDLQMPQSATIGAGGFYEISGLASFHDEDNQLDKVRIHVPLVSTTYEYGEKEGIPRGLNRGTLQLVIKFSAASPKGQMEYRVSVVDTTGLESEPVKRTVNLQ
jgi:hypothetical protein